MRRIVVSVVAALIAAVCLAACTSSSPEANPASTVTHTTTGTLTQSPSADATTPVDTGPTSSAGAAACPFVAKQSAADRVGMRLARITVQRSGGAAVGCRIYALQGGPLHQSERLPGPNQPAVQIAVQRYASAVGAHNAFVLAARKGTNPQQAQVADGNTGVCYQIDFYPKDHGRDWACAFSVGTKAVEIKTVVVTPAFNVVQVAREVASKV